MATVLSIITIILIGAFLVFVESATKKGCKISIADIEENSPLILRDSYRSGMSPFHTLSGNGTDYMTFSPGSGVRFACPDADTNSLDMPNLPRTSYEVIAYCVRDSLFTISSNPYKFSEIRCKKPPESTIQEERRCEVGLGKMLNIGFKLKRKFFGLVQICYDPEKHTTLNAIHLVSKNIRYRETDVSRSSYFSSSNFGKDLMDVPNNFYTCKKQLDNFAYLLGSRAQAQKYVICGSYYFTKGHLAANADFMFGYQQKATNYYINTTPQWHTINSGNWRLLESVIRKYASNRRKDLTVVSGTLNVATLPGINAKETKLYMTSNNDDKPTVPVPALLWKFVLDKTARNGIVFIGVNDPHHPNVAKQGYVICNDVCDKASSWFEGWDRFKVPRGYIYCCTLSDFAAKTRIKFPYRVKGLLV